MQITAVAIEEKGDVKIATTSSGKKYYIKDNAVYAGKRCTIWTKRDLTVIHKGVIVNG